MRRSRNCPVCGETGVPIVYGYPSGIVWAAAERGLVVLGGCVIYGDDPSWRCYKDEITWNGPDPSKAIDNAFLQASEESFDTAT